MFNRSLISGLVWSEIFLLFLLCILWTNEKNESGAHTVCAVCQQGVSKEQCSAHKISLCLSYCFGGRTLSACQVSFWQMQNLAVKSAIIYLSGVSIVYIEEKQWWSDWALKVPVSVGVWGEIVPLTFNFSFLWVTAQQHEMFIYSFLWKYMFADYICFLTDQAREGELVFWLML